MINFLNTILCGLGFHKPISVVKYYNNKKENYVYCSACNKNLNTKKG